MKEPIEVTKLKESMKLFNYHCKEINRIRKEAKEREKTWLIERYENTNGF